MKIGIPKEVLPGETRVAAVPDTVQKFVKAGMEILVEAGAGQNSLIADKDYEQAGAKIVPAATLYKDADIIVKVNKPTPEEVNLLRDNSILAAPLFPLFNADLVHQLKDKKITAFALDMVPRIARSQSMDILSSMSSIAGYKAILMAADRLAKLFPMMTTAAGTILPAKVMVIGAGVAGLQAIATARRLGGVVLAFDTRPVVAEQVKSLGAEFVSMETSHDQAQDAGGYAKEQSAEFYKNEQEIIRKYIKDADVIVTTALIPGKKPPLLITEQMVKEMRPGAIIVDLAAEQGGNCALTEPGKIVTKHNVTIIGLLNLPSTMAVHASFLYSKNILSFLNHLAKQLEAKQFDLTDEITKGTLITHNGEIVHPALNQKGH